MISVANITIQKEYQPGDLPPEGYLAWHEWAEIQRKAGIPQVPCAICNKWKTPQELTDLMWEMIGQKTDGTPANINDPVCNKCNPFEIEQS